MFLKKTVDSGLPKLISDHPQALNKVDTGDPDFKRESGTHDPEYELPNCQKFICRIHEAS